VLLISVLLLLDNYLLDRSWWLLAILVRSQFDDGLLAIIFARMRRVHALRESERNQAPDEETMQLRCSA
jgi:hypothetical protein